MAFDSHVHRSAPALDVTLQWKGRPRSFRLGRAAGFSALVILPLLAAWYLGATAYFVFHDQLLASLISRQADMQYAYEDRIAALRSQLERQTSRALVDHQMLTTTMRDLAARGEQLESRANAIEALFRKDGKILPGSFGRGTAEHLKSLRTPPSGVLSGDDRLLSGAPGLGSTSPALRLDKPDEQRRDPSESPVSPDTHADLSTEDQSRQLMALFAGIEARQSDHVARLREPMMRATDRLQAALAETGLPLSRWKLSTLGGVGGPFVPLPAGSHGVSFEENLSLLQQAVERRQRLVDLVDTVPLRQPLAGQLEVTSPFGARLDPFYGRAAMHTGTDFVGAYGDAVRATAGGVVTVAGPDGGYGRMVEIDHGNGLVTRYAHLSEIEVALNQRVAAGTVVGRIGSTGRATGPHLHYETRIDGEPVNPMRFLRAGTPLFGS